MRFKTLTKPQRAKHATLEAELKLQQSNVYAAALPRDDAKFNDCFQMCSRTQRAAYESAVDARERFEESMIREGRAWRASFGMFTPY